MDTTTLELTIEIEKAISDFNNSGISDSKMFRMLLGWYTAASSDPKRQKEAKEFIKAIKVLSR